MKYLTKTLFLEYSACGKNAWLKVHKPDLSSMFSLSEFERGLLAKGNLVEQWARKLFPEGILIEESGEAAAKRTEELMGHGSKALFQATFIHDGFLARNDVLEFDEDHGCWNLYEVKGTNSLNEGEDGRDHIDDASFQARILQSVGIKIGQIKIIHLNKEYVRGDEISLSELFEMEDVTEKVADRMEDVKARMDRAREALTQLDESALSCECLYVGRNSQCSTFCYSHPQVPEYSVHDLSRISKKKLESLVEDGIFDIKDVPDEFSLSDIQKMQAIAHKTQKAIIDKDAIERELSSLAFPLYFLDYESYAPAIPLFKGYKPYQQIPFQFSLDRLSGPDADFEHFEYLHEEATDPSEAIIDKLQGTIGESGTIIVWYKPFERKINSQLAERNPQHDSFLSDINARIYDLMEIFQKQFHVHPDFRGRTSIKKVLPVLVPTLTYKELEIQDGGAAMDAWYRMIFEGQTDEVKAKIAADLKKYCGRDTEAMIAIWRVLNEVVSSAQ